MTIYRLPQEFDQHAAYQKKKKDGDNFSNFPLLWDFFVHYIVLSNVDMGEIRADTVNSTVKWVGVFLSIKFATSLLASLAGGLSTIKYFYIHCISIKLS